MKKTYKCVCQACDRLLIGVTHTTNLKIVGEQYTSPMHLCVDCDATLKDGDAVINEFKFGEGNYVTTTGNVVFVLLKDQPADILEFWHKRDVQPGKITLMSDVMLDSVIEECQQLRMSPHPLAEALSFQGAVRRAKKH